MFLSLPKKALMRHLYDAVAAIAVVNLFAILAFGAYVGVTGSVNTSRLREAVSYLRGQTDKSQLGMLIGERQAASGGTASAAAIPLKNFDVDSEADMEIARREAERIQVEIDQRLALSNAVLLKVRNEREQFQKEREAAAKQDQAKRDHGRDDGLERQIALLDSLTARIAMQHLLGVQDVDDAARILAALSPEKAKKIIEAAKRGTEMTQMKAILQRVREVAPAKSSEIVSEEK